MGLEELLDKYGVPKPADFQERLDIVVAGLRGDPSYKTKLDHFSSQSGGADPGMEVLRGFPSIPIKMKPVSEDWLGPRLRWILDTSTSQYSRVMLESLFMIVFILGYVESVPVIGSIISVSLDLILMGGKMVTKTLQSILPVAIGAIPLPYTFFLGFGLSALLGMIMWPILGIISFSRKDFASSMDSFLRVVPPPMGPMIADLFLEGNRTVARMDEKRQKLVGDISSALTTISDSLSTAASKFQTGFQTFSSAVKTAPLPAPPAKQLNGGRRKSSKKWRLHRRTRRRSAKH